MINTVCLMGRFCAEPEIKTTQSGVAVLSFQIAVDRNYTPQGQERQADFIDCVAWRGTAEFIGKYFHKGSMIAITGEIQTRNYTDKGGNDRKAIEVVVSNASFCGSKENGTQGSTEQNKPNLNVSADDDFEEIVDDSDDLPF